MSATGTIKSGTAPIKYTERQPYSGNSHMLRAGAKIAPIGMPDMTAATPQARLRSGMYSEARAMALGIVPPMPIPQITRHTPKSKGLFVKPVKPMAMENTVAQHTMVYLRPILSASEPNASAPIAAPSNE